MADDSAQVEAPAAPDELPPPAPPSASDAALARYRSSMRRRRVVYYALIAALVAALGTWFGVSWSRGEVSHASLHTFAPPPPTLGIEPANPSPQQAWRTSDHLAIGQPQWGGTLVTYSEHTVGGRDAHTGQRTWGYTRTDRRVCTAAQLTGTTVAVFANKGNCDELDAFDSDTGRRRWTRTLDIDGMPIDGAPSYQTTPYTFLAAAHSVIYAIDPVTGLNRWTYQRYGCRINGVALGGTGALISQTCSGLVECQGVKFCGRGPQLFLRDGSNGRDDSKKPNADLVKWARMGDASIPVSADDVVTAVPRSGASLELLAANDGKLDRSMPLTPTTSRLGPITAIPTDSAEVIWLSGQIYALQPGASAPLWQTDAPSPPTVVSTTNQSTPALATARITIPTNFGVGVIDGNDGTVIQQITLRPPEPGSLVYSLGAGFLVAGPSGMVAYK